MNLSRLPPVQQVIESDKSDSAAPFSENLHFDRLNITSGVVRVKRLENFTIYIIFS